MLLLENTRHFDAGCDNFAVFDFDGRLGLVQQGRDIDGLGHENAPY